MSSGRDVSTVRGARAAQTWPGFVVAMAGAVLANVCLVTGLSYPGFPTDVAVCGVMAAIVSVSVAIALGSRAGAARNGRLQAVVVLTLTGAVLVSGALVARADDGQRLRARWAASQAAFQQEVSTKRAPERHDGSTETSSFTRYPGACPSRIGEFSVAECHSIDGGFVFLQAQGALSDDSGIVYLPADGYESTWWDTESMTSLGGPWWSWTCHC